MKINKIEPAESYFSIIGANKPIFFAIKMKLVVNPIFCDKDFFVLLSLWSFGHHVGDPKWGTKMAAPYILTKKV